VGLLERGLGQIGGLLHIDRNLGDVGGCFLGCGCRRRQVLGLLFEFLEFVGSKCRLGGVGFLLQFSRSLRSLLPFRSFGCGIGRRGLGRRCRFVGSLAKRFGCSIQLIELLLGGSSLLFRLLLGLGAALVLCPSG